MKSLVKNTIHLYVIIKETLKKGKNLKKKEKYDVDLQA